MSALPDTPPHNASNPSDWERRTLEKLAFAALDEQRARRRWSIFFKLATLVYLLAIFLMIVGGSSSGESKGGGRHTAVIDVQGVIEAGGEVSADKINAALRSAFQDKRTAGVVLRINSPGGSPVQSGIIFDEMRRLRGAHPDIPLYAVVEDLCASGGYYIAAGADKIYVNKASLIGSIGVLMNGFGFTGAMEKLGVERRLLTAGENKGFLDPFSPMNEQQKAHVQTLLDELHQQFIAAVRQGRGARLSESPDIFSGLIWSGEQGVKLGLADELGTVDFVAREVIKAERLVDYSVKENLAERFAKRLGADAASSFGKTLMETLNGDIR
jgi:protease-4